MSAMIDEPKRLELISLGFNEAISKNFDQAIINSIKVLSYLLFILISLLIIYAEVAFEWF